MVGLSFVCREKKKADVSSRQGGKKTSQKNNLPSRLTLPNSSEMAESAVSEEQDDEHEYGPVEGRASCVCVYVCACVRERVSVCAVWGKGIEKNEKQVTIGKQRLFSASPCGVRCTGVAEPALSPALIHVSLVRRHDMSGCIGVMSRGKKRECVRGSACV